MGIIHIPDALKARIDQQITAGRAASEAEYVAEALLAYAEHIETEDEIAAMVERADRDIASGLFVTVATPEQHDMVHHDAMARLRASLSRDDSAR